jgi:hypothetical protein
MTGPGDSESVVDCVSVLVVRALAVGVAALSDASVRLVVEVLLGCAAEQEVAVDGSLRLVRTLAVELGRGPRAVEYEAARQGVIGAVGASALSRRYGGWEGVLRAGLVAPAGWGGVGRVSGRVVRWYPDARLVECVAACWLWVGHRPSAPEYARWRSFVVAGSVRSRVVGMDVPAVSTITLRFRWLEATRLARPLVEAQWR